MDCHSGNRSLTPAERIKVIGELMLGMASSKLAPVSGKSPVLRIDASKHSNVKVHDIKRSYSTPCPVSTGMSDHIQG